jgi:hypothetical protein
MPSIAERLSRIRFLIVAGTGLTLVACGGQKSPHAADTRSTSAPSAATAPPTTTPIGGKAPCPATGQWSDCAVFQALDRAGLAPRRDSPQSSVTVAPLTNAGTRLLLGSAELDVFVYPDAGARERDESRLDKRNFIEASDEPTLRGEPTLIRNVNLLAVLRSRNDHQRERVSDALSAGPPQPSGAAALPKTNVPK